MSEDSVKAMGSLIFIFCYACFHTRSLWLSIMGLFAVLCSFPVAILAHVYVYGNVMSFLNLVSLWIILGIGADDIFVFVDCYNQTPEKDHEGKPVPANIRLTIAYVSLSLSCSKRNLENSYIYIHP